MSAKKPNMSDCWYELLKTEFEKDYMNELRLFLKKEFSHKTLYPPMSLVFNAFKESPFKKVKAVILGQDPYHGPGQAHGLCFSVKPPTPPPPSLVNIYRELHDDIGIKTPTHGSLNAWARQGVFLLNTVLTVEAHRANSHRNRGWEIFTDKVISILNEKKENLVFFLWGSSAKSKADKVDKGKHLVLTAPHPSPLSADRGFFGCKHFSKANAYLKSKEVGVIDWEL